MAIKRAKLPEAEFSLSSLSNNVRAVAGEDIKTYDVAVVKLYEDVQSTSTQFKAQLQKVEEASKVEGSRGAVAIQKEVGILQAIGNQHGAAMVAVLKEMIEQRETHHTEDASSGRSDRRWDRIVNVGVGLGGGVVGSLVTWWLTP